MLIMKIFDKITGLTRHPKYNQLSNKVKSIQLEESSQLESEFKKIKLTPGQSIFFWHKKVNYVDHIAIVPSQDKRKLNLLEAKLIHGTPPPIGGKDYFSGIRLGTALEFIGNTELVYSRVIIGTPHTASSKELQHAGDLAKEMGRTKKIDNKIVVYSFPIINRLFYVKWFDFNSHLKVKIGIPYLIAKRETGKFNGWLSTYCGDLVGQVYQRAGIKRLPKIKFLDRKHYRSSTFYEWMKRNHSLNKIVMWGDQMPERY